MKHTRKILVALIITITLLMTLVTIPASAATMKGGEVLYLVPNSNWTQANARFAAYFFGSGETWVSMTKVDDKNLYQVTVPSGSWTNVIFCRMNPSASANNWNNTWNQTSDLTYDGSNNCYTVASGAWSKGSGTWSKYAFTVVGDSADMFGVTWTPNKAENDMSFNSSTKLYEKTYYNVAAGNYNIKVALNHTWDIKSWGGSGTDGNYPFTLNTDVCSLTIQFDGSKITYSTVAAHTYSNGVCSVCQNACAHESYTNGVCTECGIECAHTEYTNGVCSVCQKACAHESYTNSVCDECGIVCVHESYNNGVCNECGFECAHENYVNNVCSVCGKGCSHNYSSVVTKPTCTKDGYTTYTCSICGDSYVGDKVDATGHSYNAVVTAPTCISGGYTTYTCSCSDSYVGDETNATGIHTYVDGECSVCHKTDLENTVTVYFENNWLWKDLFVYYWCDETNEYFDKYENAAWPGVKLTADDIVGKVDGHDVYKIVLPIKADGFIVSGTKNNSSASDQTPDIKSGWANCVCYKMDWADGNQVVTGTYHDNNVVIDEPTCEEAGLSTSTCKICGTVTTDNLDAKGHTEVVDAAVAPTCTETGLTEGKHCSVCNKVLIVQNVVDAKGHTYNAVVTAPTCTEGGYTTYTCTCGDSYVADQVNANGHTYNAVVTAPTCTAEGYTTYTCTCGDSYVADQVNANGHTYNAVVTAPTCTAEGYTTYTCTCGDSYVADRVGVLNHSFTNYVSNGNATCTNDGTKTAKCDRCDVTDTIADEGSATGHSYNAVVTKPTFDAQGYTTYTCACGDSYVADYVDALDAIAQIGDVKYESVQEAIDAAKAGEIVVLLADVSLEASILLDGDKYNVVLDLAGHTITAGYEGDRVEVILAKNGAKLTITGNGRMEANGDGEYVEVISSVDGAVVTIKNGAFVSDGCTAIYATRSGIVNIEGGYYEIKELYYGKSYLLDVNEMESVLGVINVSGGSFVDFDPANHSNDSSYSNKLVDGYHSIKNSNVYSVSAHEYDAVVTNPDCVNGGYTTHTCVCGDSYKDSATSALGHSYNAVVTKPTFDAQGYTTYTCACGDSYVADYIDALDAIAQIGDVKYESVQEAIDAAKAGETVVLLADVSLEASIILDGDKYNVVLDLAGHTITAGYEGDRVEVILAKNGAKLTITGNGRMEANGSGEYVEVISSVDGAVVTIKNGAFVSDGCTAIYATRSGIVNIEGGYYEIKELYNGMSFLLDVNEMESVLGVINVSGGSFVDFDPANHSNDSSYSNKLVDGYHSIKNSNVYSVSAHEYDAVVTNPDCVNGGYTTHTCVCGDSYKDSATSALGHTLEVVPGKEASCTETGLTDGKKCSVCQAVTVEQEVIPVQPHTEEVVAGKAASCIESGLTDGKKCSVCQAVTVEQEVIPATGHTEEIVPGKDASCTVAGLTEGKKCSVCQIVLVAQTEIPVVPHVYDEGAGFDKNCNVCGYERSCAHETTETVNGKEASCTESGLTEGTICSICKEAVVAQQVIPATGHSEEVVPGKDASCTESGLTDGKKCSVCQVVIVEQSEIPVKAHTEEIVAGKEASCTESGLTEGKKCSVCQTVTVAQNEIPAIGHTEVIDDQVAPTCTTVGYTEGKHCSVCNTVIVAQETVPVLSHTEEVVPGKAASCTEGGLTDGKKCSVCQTVTVEQTKIPAIGHKYEDGKCACGDAAIGVTDEVINNVISGNTDVSSEKINEIVDEIISSPVFDSFEFENLPEDAELVIEFVGMTVNGGESVSPVKIIYEVAPMKGDSKLNNLDAPITFRLPVPASVIKPYAEVFHEGVSMGKFEIKEINGSKYVEVSSAEFSKYSVVPVDAPVVDNDEIPEGDNATEEESKTEKITYIICMAIVAVAIFLAVLSLVRKPRLKPWWMI